jgi:hypothetical protein
MYNHEVPFLFPVNMYIAFYLNRLNFLVHIVANLLHVITLFSNKINREHLNL